jgi:hypothetical protein
MSPIAHLCVRQGQSRVATPLVGNPAPTGTIAAKPGVSARGTAPGLRHKTYLWGSQRWSSALRGLRIEFAYQVGPYGLKLRGQLRVDLAYTVLQHFHLEAERIHRGPLVALERLDGLSCQDELGDVLIQLIL